MFKLRLYLSCKVLQKLTIFVYYFCIFAITLHHTGTKNINLIGLFLPPHITHLESNMCVNAYHRCPVKPCMSKCCALDFFSKTERLSVRENDPSYNKY